MQEEDLLISKVNAVTDTLKFHGVKIVGLSIDDAVPEFKVCISPTKAYPSITEALSFTYWTLWTLIYGKHTRESESNEIRLRYKEEEWSNDET